MKKQIKPTHAINQGSSGFWYVRTQGRVIAGFENESYAKIFTYLIQNWDIDGLDNDPAVIKEIAKKLTE